MNNLHLLLILHAHQPVGNFDHIFERNYRVAYLPFIETLSRHPGVRAGLHYSGSLLEWIEPHHPEYFDLLRTLVQRGQIELIGGGFYEPILIAIPPECQQDQVSRMTGYIELHFGQRPAGAWLTERVWEPQLPLALHKAGVEYTLVDDTHFLAAGFEPEQLFGYYIAEDSGACVKVIPGLKELRYLIPFRSVEDNLGFFRTAARDHSGAFACMGDDLEKLGAWPGTHEHCYKEGWLDRFFSALESNRDWLAMTLPREYLAAHPPLGRADLPTASYPEMMEWVLPTPARERFHRVQQELAARGDVQPFLRGGFWRGFFSKYAEANLLHKKMLHVAGRIRRAARHAANEASAAKKLADAKTHLLRAQCNDAYWHGVFGGLYSPHLRTELWSQLIRAETIADSLDQGSSGTKAERLDFDADGVEEIYITSKHSAALLKPSEGATIAALEFRPSAVPLVNSLERRVEAYHAHVKNAGKKQQGVSSIHEQTRVKEAGLEQHLKYDRWPRHAFRLLLFPPWKTANDHAALTLEESVLFAAGPYAVKTASPESVELRAEGPLIAPLAGQPADPSLCAVKTFTFGDTRAGFDVGCEIQLSYMGPLPLKLLVGLEVVLNFLAPNSPDRYIESAANERHPLRWTGVMPAPKMRVVDEWQGVAASFEAPRASQFWIAPVETVSESEDGFERVYQGSQIMAVWGAEVGGKTPWKAPLNLRISRVRD